MECPICFELKDEIIYLHNSNHYVCKECNEELRINYIKKCPLCRENINDDLIRINIKVISDIQLLSFRIKQETIDNIRNRYLPFYYIDSESAINFINMVKEIEINN